MLKLNWLSVKVRVFSTFQTQTYFLTEVVVFHSVILNGLDVPRAKTPYLQNPFFKTFALQHALSFHWRLYKRNK